MIEENPVGIFESPATAAGDGEREGVIEIDEGSDEVEKMPPKLLECFSQISSDEAASLQEYLAEGYTLRIPDDEEPVCWPRDGEIGVYVSNFDYGLRFPMCPFTLQILRFLELPLYAITPNSFAQMSIFYILCKHLEVPPTLDLFRWFFEIKRGKGIYYLSCRKRWSLVEDLKKKVKDYPYRFVFIAGPSVDSLPAEWPQTSATLRMKLSEEEEAAIWITGLAEKLIQGGELRKSAIIFSKTVVNHYIVEDGNALIIGIIPLVVLT